MARSRLLDLVGGTQPTGVGSIAGDAQAPVGTDAIPTAGLESAAPPPPAPGPEAQAGGQEQPPDGIQSILGAPDMTPEERARLQAELDLAARQRLMEGLGPNA